MDRNRSREAGSFWVLPARPALGQTFHGSLVGSVQDSTGAVAPGRRTCASLKAHPALAACCLATGDYASAGQEFQAGFSRSPDKAEAWYRLGRDSMELMSELVVKQPDAVWAIRLGWTYWH